MIHKGTVPLETERLILRRFELSDADALFNNWANDAEVTKYLTWPPHSDISVSKAVIDSWMKLYENLNHYSWAIVLKDIGEPIGSIAAVQRRDDTKMVHLGYCIGRNWWRQGYTSEALAELIRFFFEDIGANRIESRHDPRNPNSGKVMLKCGLKYEGTLRQSDINNQSGFCDAEYYAILAEEYFLIQQKSSILTFSPYNLIADREFLIAAHMETFKMTFKQDIKPEWLYAELAKPRDVRDGAYLDGKLVGICDLQRRSKEDSDDYGKVNFYFIAPEYRNRGFGAQLIAHSADWCHNQGLKMLTLNTGKDNFQAQKCYENNGFIRFPQIDTDDEFGYVKMIDIFTTEAETGALAAVPVERI